MKIRTGFVSNSSSSSFVLVTTLEYWEQVKATLHPYAVAVAEAIMSKPQKALGQTLVAFSTWSSQDSSWTSDLNVDADAFPQSNHDSVYDAWDAALTALRQDPTQIFEHDVEMD